ncbi:odorant receptor 59 isoform X1 [Nasonia vitripennis]|uniref:Odorant receptor n=1 Tax=Nasonia vitripennis TaxID=7425 RepID=A0A7M7QEF9_NASVI|nr:odorant receptor 59 isoform X1 [Nasonia vitripennis]
MSRNLYHDAKIKCKMNVITYLLKCLNFLRFMGKIYAVWPLKTDDNIRWRFVYECLWWFYFLNYLVAASFTLNTCGHASDDITIASFSWLEFVSMVESIIILINYKCYHVTLQLLLTEVEDYLTLADEKKQWVLKEKASIFAVMMCIITFLYFVLVVLYFTNPAITAWETFLTTSYYPPAIRSPVMDVFLFSNQLIVMCHTSVIVNLDAMVVLLIYICSVRLKVLAADLESVNDDEELKQRIREHQHILCLAKKTNIAVRLVVSKTVICFISYTVGAGLQLVNPTATVASLQRFGIVLLINYVRLIMNATSADELLTVSRNVGLSIYSTDWYGESKIVTSSKFIVMLRCQKLVRIHVDGVMPALTLTFITGVSLTMNFLIRFTFVLFLIFCVMSNADNIHVDILLYHTQSCHKTKLNVAANRNLLW